MRLYDSPRIHYVGAMKFWHDLKSYDDGQVIQQEARQRVEQSGKLEIHGFEFQKVITLGRRASLEQDLQVEAEFLLHHGFSIRHVDRGGEATLHNPGQLVIYPIVNLRTLGLTVREFVAALQNTTVDLLKAYGVSAGLIEGCPGVYTSKGKIGFVGVRIQRSVTTHGLSLNVANNLDDFQMIRSCGVLRPKLDKLREWAVDATNKELHAKWSELFLKRLLLDQIPRSGLSHGPFDLRS